MSAVKFFSLLFAWLIGIAALLISLWALGLFVVSPALFNWTTKRADTENDQYWAEGIAHVYALEGVVSVGDKTYHGASEIICAPKWVTEPLTFDNERRYYRGTDHKGGWENVETFPTDVLTVDLPDGKNAVFRHSIRLCVQLENIEVPTKFPMQIAPNRMGIKVVDRTSARGITQPPSIAPGKTTPSDFTLKLHAPRDEPLRLALSRDEYGKAAYGASTFRFGLGGWFPEP